MIFKTVFRKDIKARAKESEERMSQKGKNPLPDDGTDPVKLIGNFNSWLLSNFSALGVTIVIYGIYQIVTTWTSHDVMQRINSILFRTGGLKPAGIISGYREEINKARQISRTRIRIGWYLLTA